MTEDTPQPDTELRIMRNGDGWYWEVVTEGNRVASRGIADTEQAARQAANEAARFPKLIDPALSEPEAPPSLSC